jgi:CHAT domain-containing protein
MPEIPSPPKFLRFGIILLLLLCFQTLLAGDFEELKSGEIRVMRLKGGEKHFFAISANAGNCLSLVIEQQGIDVAVTVRAANGSVIKKTDRPSGAYGRETVTFPVPQSGTLKVEINTYLTSAVAGNYRISFTETSAMTDADRRRDLAENLTSEGEELRGSDPKKAIERFSEALKIWQELGDTYEQAVVLYGIGFSHGSLSNFYEAASVYYRSFKLFSELGDDFGKAINYTGLGSVQYPVNENELAIYNYKKAIEIYKKMSNARGLGIAFHGLGTAEMLLENHDAAIADLSESLRWRVLGNDHGGKAFTHITLGKLYLFLKLYDKAEIQFSEAEKSLGEKRAGTDPELLYYRGKFYLSTEQTEKAKDFLQRAIDVYRQRGNKLGAANGLLDLSRAALRSGETKKSLENIESALALIENLRQSALDFQTRVNFSATVQPFYEHYVALLMRLNELEPGKNFHEKALEISEQARARGLLDRLERRALIRRNRVEPALLERERQLHDKLTGLLALQSKNRKTAEFQEISAQFSEVGAEINRRLSAPEIAAPPTLKSAEIKNYLDDKTVLLEYSLSEEESFLWFVSTDEIAGYRLPPGREIEETARKVFECFSLAAKTKDETACHENAKKLSADLLKPVAGKIEGKRLAVVKHGFLHYIPFAALPGPSGAKYLLETNEILNLTSASVLKLLREAKPQTSAPKTLAVFADPVYSPTDARIRVKPKGKPDSGNFSRLFASRFEAGKISSFVPAADGLLVKMDFEAARENFFKSDLGSYRILHFAAHALVDDRQPELSSIALSFYDRRGNEISGFLRPNDILRLDLNAELVVLSACRSGAGKQVKGEGIISLGQSFFSAGARRLIVSSWDVDDKVTAELMTRFYRKHLAEKQSISTALRESQLEILRDRRWRSPFYWAAFNLEGDW